MEKYFGNAYRGDPGVPHADPERFVNIWIGSAAFSVLTWFNPYLWQLSNQFKSLDENHALKVEHAIFMLLELALIIKVLIDCWHDKAMLFEQYHWKKAMKKGQPYKFKWNELPREVRDSYYYNWPVYFP
ncbi:hypothetical protein RJ641_028160 [Dillenia turbinata]|uniref:Uncharacterized protein n=1 Tax=Dillenia turbinata TaxID=194707 RepID=A0AAN8ZQ98_9MAGN